MPNRFEYGYGLTPEIVALTAREKAPDIIITVDNGIASIDGVAEANRLGIEVVVTDHHLPGDTLPAARVIVNPNQPECGFPSKNLAGVGVMFYVLLALRAELRRRGVFDAADPAQPRQPARPGGAGHGGRRGAGSTPTTASWSRRASSACAPAACTPAWRRCSAWPAREARSASPFDLGFALGPRLNAAGRLDDMSLGIECLITDDEGRAWAIAQQLDAINRKRREIEAEMQDAALLHLDAYRAGRQQHHQRVRRRLAPGRDRHRRLAPEGEILPPDDHLRARRATAGSRARAARSPASTCATRSTWCPSARPA